MHLHVIDSPVGLWSPCLLWPSPARGCSRSRRPIAAMRAHVFPGDVASLARTDFARAITDW